MPVRELRDRSEIMTALSSEDRFLHLYEIGDLDDFFFPATRWFAPEGGAPPLILIYSGTDLPVLLALTAGHRGSLALLLREVRETLPTRIYAHLSPGLVDVLAERYEVEPHGNYTKMGLVDPLPAPHGRAVPLGPDDRTRLERFYAESYPGNWFDPRMLETGMYRGVVEDEEIVAAGGIHVFSAAQRVAAIGNVAVRPLYRGRGLGAAVTNAVCHALAAAGVSHVGLNVKTDNHAAIACYERLGFARVGIYDEYMLTARAAL
jgi:ribosomal protein S18 acetylase RimI-like enzyme